MVAGSARRPVAEQSIRAAQLGYAESGYSAALRQLGHEPEQLYAAGLVDRNGGEVYADRLTFPWLNLAGTEVLGLGGRAIVNRRPKYVNTPEPTFTKGNAVFGISAAAPSIHQARWSIIVEGPFDALALWDLGWPNAVATVGATVTDAQLAQVLRLADTTVVLLDADEGGRRGAEALAARVAAHPLPARCRVLTARLVSAGKDVGDPATTLDDIAQALRSATDISYN